MTVILYNTHHAHISHNVRDQRWRACNWIWFHSLDDEQPTNWALSSASSTGHSNQSVNLKKASRHNVGLQHQNTVVHVSVKSTEMSRVLLINLASYTGKSLLTWCSWGTSSAYKHQYRAFILSHMYQALWLNLSI